MKPSLDLLLFTSQLARSLGFRGTVLLFINYYLTAKVSSYLSVSTYRHPLLPTYYSYTLTHQCHFDPNRTPLHTTLTSTQILRAVMPAFGHLAARSLSGGRV